eukprot:s1_g2034.t1
MDQIIVTEEDITDQPYRVIGDIDVTVNKTTLFHPDPTRALVDQELREEAYKAGPLRLQNSVALISGLLVLAACARAAPSLPSAASVSASSLTEAERSMSCADIEVKLDENKQESQRLNDVINGNRDQNQAVGYVAAVAFPPLALATESNTEEKEGLDRLQAERDQLYRVKRVKAC